MDLLFLIKAHIFAVAWIFLAERVYPVIYGQLRAI